jgi:small subunit ribosomal protein S18
MNKMSKKNISNNLITINYKNSNFLKKFITNDGKILPKFVTALSPKDQRRLSKSIKMSRIVGLLKFTNN